MTIHDTAAPKAQLATLRTQLVAWLIEAAYPLWSQNGIDPRNGGFIEALYRDGHALPHPRRARVQPRQIYAFAQAHEFGWKGDVRGIVRRGSDYFTAHYLRPDGLFRTLAGCDGGAMDDRALLYDQAFALLGHAAAAVALDARTEFERRAIALREAIGAHFRTVDGAFWSDESGTGFLESNPHMHLLEACLAWAEIGRDPDLTLWIRNLVDIAIGKFIRGGDGRPGNGALGESFTAHWLPAPGIVGRIVEPGHQFEWAWLLLRAQRYHPGPLRAAALRLIEIGENFGVHQRVAINALLDDLSIHDPNARLWPQTERLKAALLAARSTAEAPYWAMAAAAASSLLPYLRTAVPGLWFDVQRPTGELVDAPAPASTFYHLVGAVAALDKSL